MTMVLDRSLRVRLHTPTAQPFSHSQRILLPSPVSQSSQKVLRDMRYLFAYTDCVVVSGPSPFMAIAALASPGRIRPIW